MSELVDDLTRLRDAVEAVPFALPDSGREQRVEARDRLVREIDGMLARLAHPHAPLLCVLGGGTGAGKSTLTNTLAGAQVSATGVIRPTSYAPTLVTHPGDASWFTDDRFLTHLRRVRGSSAAPAQGSDVLQIRESAQVRRGFALLDAPDIDSVVGRNRQLAEGLLDAADVWLWLVTPRSYADAEGMEYLRLAARRGTVLAVVLTQVRPDEAAVIRADLEHKLRRYDVEPRALLEVAHVRGADGVLPDDASEQVLRFVEELAADPATVRRTSIAGAVAALDQPVEVLATEVESELRVADELLREAARAYDGVTDRLAEELERGVSVRSEVLRRWTDLVGSPRALELMQTATGRMEGWVRELWRNVAGGLDLGTQREVRVEVTDAVGSNVRSLLEVAAADTAAAWVRQPAGRELLDRAPQLRRASPDLDRRVEGTLDTWQAHIIDLVERVGGSRKVQARRLSTAASTVLGTALVALFATTGGLTGGEAGLSAVAAAANQALLVRMLGEKNLRDLQRETAEDLTRRVAALATEEQARYRRSVEALAPDRRLPDRLRERVQRLAEHRP